MANKIINIINVPSDIGSIYAGKSKAPAALKDAGLHKKLGVAGYQVKEFNAFSSGPVIWTSSNREPNGARNEIRTVEACKKVSNTIASILDSNDEETHPFQLILSSECLYCPAILSSYWKHLDGTGKRVGIIYLDADCDLYYPREASSSGTIAGMTMTHLTLRDGALESMKCFSRPDGSGVVDNSNIVLFGLNINSEANKRDHLGYLFDNNFRVVTSSSVQKSPLETARAALEWLEQRVDYILVHLDVDVIDPGEFPLCHMPNWTGLGFEKCMKAVKVFLKSTKCVAMSVAEVNPDHDPGLEMTGRLVDEIVDGLGFSKVK